MGFKRLFVILVLFAVWLPFTALGAAESSGLCSQYLRAASCQSGVSQFLQSRFSAVQLQCQTELAADRECSKLIQTLSPEERKDKFNDCSIRDICDAGSAFDTMADGCRDALYDFGKEKWEELKLTWQRIENSAACNADLPRKLAMFEEYNRSVPTLLQRPVLPVETVAAMNCSEIARVLNGFAINMSSTLDLKARTFETQNPKLKGQLSRYPRELAEFRQWQYSTAASEAEKFRKTLQGIRNLPEKVQSLFQSLGINLRCYNAKQRTKLACYGAILVAEVAVNPMGSLTRGSLRSVSLVMKAAGEVEKVQEVKAAGNLTERMRKLYEQAELKELKRVRSVEEWRHETFPPPVVTTQQFQNIQDLYRAGDVAKAAAYERKIANTLSSAKMEFAGDVGEGVSGAKYVKFSDGTYGIWKPDRILTETINSSGAAGEIAAYKVDQFLDLHKVPVTVSRRFNGEKGTVQLMVGDLKGATTTYNPDDLKLFDYLIDNGDRHYGNYLRTSDGRMVGIDHGLAAQAGRRAPNVPLELDLAVSQVATATAEVPAAVVARTRVETMNYLASIVGEKESYLKMKNTSEETWRGLLQSELNGRQMSEFLTRRNKLIESVEKVRQKFGDDVFRAGPSSPLVK